jgi:hypothetical protein
MASITASTVLTTAQWSSDTMMRNGLHLCLAFLGVFATSAMLVVSLVR